MLRELFKSEIEANLILAGIIGGALAPLELFDELQELFYDFFPKDKWSIGNNEMVVESNKDTKYRFREYGHCILVNDNLFYILLSDKKESLFNRIRLKCEETNDLEVAFFIGNFVYRFTRDDVEAGFTYQDRTFIDLYKLIFKKKND